ncbi:MAG TPA: AsmA family protein [Acidobacteriota bacterium]|nr:AsmA family protein [Acidobacteriota bacterium]HQF86764.1 AsmA family protein [Acidobacteriota bacterium]HQG91438.1 AsmA family protein [Acidobacteriota bacterium]
MAEGSGKRFGWLKWTGIALAAVGALLVAVVLLVDVNRFKPEMEQELGRVLGRTVTLGRIHLALLDGGLRIDSIAIAEDPAFGREPFIRSQSLSVTMEWVPFIKSRALRVTDIRLESPYIRLIRAAGGRWNFSSLAAGNASPAASAGEAGRSPAAVDLQVRRLVITGGRVRVVHADEGGKTFQYEDVRLDVRDFSPGARSPFEMVATLPVEGKLAVQGHFGPIDSGDIARSPLEADVQVDDLDIAASGFLKPEAGPAGVVNYVGKVSHDGTTIRSQGKVRVDRLRVMKGAPPAGRPVAVTYTLVTDPAARTGRLEEAAVTVGGAVARLAGTFAPAGESTQIDMTLRGEVMPVEDLMALLPALGVELPQGAALRGGTLGADLAVKGPVEALVTTGTVAMRDTRLTGFDLGSGLSAVAGLVGIKTGQDTPIQLMGGDLKMTPAGIEFGRIRLVMSAIGQLDGAGRIGADNSLDFRMRATLTENATGVATRLTGLKQSGPVVVPFRVQGTTRQPVFTPEVQGLIREELKGWVGEKTAGQVGSFLEGVLGSKKKK